jgi:hypothetical protein
MKSKRIQLLLTGGAAWISLLLMITTTYGAGIVIGGNYTDIGTIVIVSPKPGDTPQANGTALLNNLAGITADANNPYVIKLGPGIYDLGATSLQMKEFVSIEGSGEKTTKITAAINNSDWTPTAATLIGANNAELRFLTVENTSVGPNYAIAILNSSVSPSLIHVTATASGQENNMGVYNFSTGASPSLIHVTATASSGGSNYGIYNDSWASPKMTNVTAIASGGGYNVAIYNHNSFSYTMTNVTAIASGGGSNYGVNNNGSPSISYSVTMINVTATASEGTTNYGVYNDNSGTVKINHSVIKGATTVYNGSGVTTYVGNTQLDGAAVSNSGVLTCVGAYDGNYVTLGVHCE